ncbi:MAG: hypothetical protein HY874_11935 [Chloroflexi bacterium]|nr:hypothetical protein [Chloroflexota bacterium]
MTDRQSPPGDDGLIGTSRAPRVSSGLNNLPDLASSSIDLIYVRAPFFPGAEHNVIWGDTSAVRTFSDIWEGGLDTYLLWLDERLPEMRRILRDSGSICVHCDWSASHYIKAKMNEIFGLESFRNEIAWKRSNPRHAGGGNLPGAPDVILRYSRGAAWSFNKVFAEDDQSYLATFASLATEASGKEKRAFLDFLNGERELEPKDQRNQHGE